MNTKRNTCRHAASFLLALLLSLTLCAPTLAAEKEVEIYRVSVCRKLPICSTPMS